MLRSGEIAPEQIVLWKAREGLGEKAGEGLGEKVREGLGWKVGGKVGEGWRRLGKVRAA